MPLHIGGLEAMSVQFGSTILNALSTNAKLHKLSHGVLFFDIQAAFHRAQRTTVVDNVLNIQEQPRLMRTSPWCRKNRRWNSFKFVSLNPWLDSSAHGDMEPSQRQCALPTLSTSSGFNVRHKAGRSLGRSSKVQAHEYPGSLPAPPEDSMMEVTHRQQRIYRKWCPKPTATVQLLRSQPCMYLTLLLGYTLFMESMIITTEAPSLSICFVFCGSYRQFHVLFS